MLDVLVIYSLCFVFCILNCCVEYHHRMRHTTLYESDNEIEMIETVEAEPMTPRSASEVIVKIKLTTNDIIV